MLTVYFTMGLPASGKSTWALNKMRKSPNQIKRVSKGDLRAMLDNACQYKDTEEFVVEVQEHIVRAALARGKHVIIDDTNLMPDDEVRVRNIITTSGVEDLATLKIVDFRHISPEICIERDHLRPNSVGEKAIMKMYDQFIAPARSPRPIYNPALPDAIICDLDGTLALIGDRNPYDAAQCENDQVNEAVRSILQTSGKKIILVSGRQDQYRPQTLAWLTKHQIEFESLYMRKSGDLRKDSIVKQEIYTEFICNKYNVIFVLDDRDQVVRLWRDLGLTCLQVDYGNF